MESSPVLRGRLVAPLLYRKSLPPVGAVKQVMAARIDIRQSSNSWS